jgi:hypothetical protein
MLTNAKRVATRMTQFRDLNKGATFDFIGPDRFNSYFRKCLKVSARSYIDVEDQGNPVTIMRVGSINAEVFHVNEE